MTLSEQIEYLEKRIDGVQFDYCLPCEEGLEILESLKILKKYQDAMKSARDTIEQLKEDRKINPEDLHRVFTI